MFLAKYPAFFSIPLLKSCQKTFVGFSKRFHKYHLRKHFIHLCLSVINQGSTRLTEAGQVVSGTTTSLVANLSHFLKDTSWSVSVLIAMHQSFILKHLPKKLYVPLDMTALKKTGKHFEYLAKVHDGRTDGVVDGYQLLMSLGVNQADVADQMILNHDLISSKHPEWTGENPAVVAHIKQLMSIYKKAKISIQDVTHLGDRGFDREPFVRTFMESEMRFLIRAKDKKAKLKDGTETKLYQLDRGVYHNVYLEAWNMSVNVVVTKAREKENDAKEKTVVMLTNIPIRELSSRRAKELYQKRWLIETCFKTLKSNYGLEDFRVRSWEAIKKIISLTLLTFDVSRYYLRIWRERIKGSIRDKKSHILSSIYYVRKYLQRMLYFGFEPLPVLTLAEH